jgi:hypothetical protein
MNIRTAASSSWLGAETRSQRPTAPLVVPSAQVRAPSIEGPSPPAALCEATASSAGSAACFSVSTAGQRRGYCSPEALRGQLGPATLAGGGRSWHLAGVRSTRAWPSSQAERSGRCPGQSQRATPMCSWFSSSAGRPTIRGAPRSKTTQLRLSTHPEASAARHLVPPTLSVTPAAPSSRLPARKLDERPRRARMGESERDCDHAEQSVSVR